MYINYLLKLIASIHDTACTMQVYTCMKLLDCEMSSPKELFSRHCQVYYKQPCYAQVVCQFVKLNIVPCYNIHAVNEFIMIQLAAPYSHFPF